ncbi:hypothetical protein AOLI_G00242140 [Acnodon oligacanthus]
MELFRQQDDRNQPVKISLRCSVTLVDCERLLEQKGVKKDGGYFIYLLTGEENSKRFLNQRKTRAQSRPRHGKRFSHDTMRLHQTLHTGHKPHSCSQHGKSLALLTEHDKMQHKNKAEQPCYKCMQCKESYTGLEDLRKHMHHHEISKKIVPKRFQCDRCEFSFRTVYELEKHTRTHEKKKYKCTTCGDSFTSEGHRISHLRVHVSEVNYHSDKIFGTASTPRSFKGIFPCKMCQKTFSTLVQLRNHQRCHST